MLPVGQLLCYAPHSNILRGERSLKLLIAVKSEIIADSLASSLSMHNVHACNTGTDALAMLETLQPEILLLDLSLPVIDGFTLLHRSRHKPKYILALTNFVAPAVLQAAAEAGVQNIILLPCTVRHIIELLNAQIKKPPLRKADP